MSMIGVKYIAMVLFGGVALMAQAQTEGGGRPPLLSVLISSSTTAPSLSCPSATCSRKSFSAARTTNVSSVPTL